MRRGKWGDFAPPDWLKYYGLMLMTLTATVIWTSSPAAYFYHNPGGDMTGRWTRTDLGLNSYAMLFVDVDGDEFADCIAVLPGRSTGSKPKTAWASRGQP